jgi:hypothetical protein
MGAQIPFVTLLLVALTVINPGTAPAASGEQAGYLLIPQTDAQGNIHLNAEPYYPQAGDILLYDSMNRLDKFMIRLAGSDAPSHSAIVVNRADGRIALLEVGPNSRPMAFTDAQIVDVFPRLESYPGVVFVRRVREPLKAEQCATLTDFAQRQDGKKFAVGRLALQITPIRCRYGLRRELFACTRLDRKRWICSENVVAAATIIGLLDPAVHFANAMYPRDLAYDEKYDLSASYQSPVLWVASMPGAASGN